MADDQRTPTAEPETVDELPDPRLLWRWVGKATRPVVGWVLIGVGALAILIGYFGVSREALVAKQIPYLVSGGITGMVLVAIGAFFLGTEDLRKQLARLDRIERQVNELHRALLVPLDLAQVDEITAVGAETLPVADSGTGSTGDAHFVALTSGQTFHRPDCRMIEGKPAERLTPSVVKRRKLAPCRLCEPVLVNHS